MQYSGAILPFKKFHTEILTQILSLPSLTQKVDDGKKKLSMGEVRVASGKCGVDSMAARTRVCSVGSSSVQRLRKEVVEKIALQNRVYCLCDDDRPGFWYYRGLNGFYNIMRDCELLDT